MALGDDFIGILRRYGHTVTLQRRVPDKGTGPYREIAGGRYLPRAEQWTAYRWFPQTSRRVKDADAEREGLVGEIDALFYFEPRAKVKTGDLIAEPAPFEREGRVSFRVERVIPFYMGPTCVYIAAHCKRINPVS